MAELFSPLNFANGISAKNRLTVAAMTNTQSHADGSLGPDELAWLTRLAEGGFGMVTTCASHISFSAKTWHGQLGCHSDAMLPGLSQLAEMFTQHQSLGILQIFHGGCRASQAVTGVQPVSASAFQLDIPNFEVPRALSVEEIHQIIEDFGQATERAYRAGFAGVQIHGANGYLITQFISTQTNLRTDEYGGTLANRARLAREVVRACKAKVPASFLVGIRLLPEGAGLDLDENVQIAQWLYEDGADYIDLSLGAAMAPPQKYPDRHTPLFSYFRKALPTQAVLFAGGGITTYQQAQALIDANIDGVTLGRIAIGNPAWPRLSQSQPQAIKPMPYSLADLRASGVSESFIHYLSEQLPAGFSQTIIVA